MAIHFVNGVTLTFACDYVHTYPTLWGSGNQGLGTRVYLVRVLLSVIAVGFLRFVKLHNNIVCIKLKKVSVARLSDL